MSGSMRGKWLSTCYFIGPPLALPGPMKHLLCLAILVLALIPTQDAEACSPVIEQPETDRGFDQSKSPAPEILDIYGKTFDDGGGCVENTCSGQESVEGEVASDVPITHVAVATGDPSYPMQYGRVDEMEAGVYAFSILGDSAEGLRFYTAEGYHSAPQDVDVPSGDSGGCSLSQTRTSRYGFLLLALVLSFGWRRKKGTARAA